MQHINQVLETCAQQKSSQTTCTDNIQDRLSRSMAAVREVFRVLQATKGHKFSSMFPTPDLIDDAVKIWAMEVMDARLTPKQLAHGLRKATTKEGFCPDLAEFIGMCRITPADLGLPTAEQAYREACQNAHPASRKEWTHKAVWHAAKQVGMYELRSLGEQETWPMFERAYTVTVRALMDGEDLPDVPKALDDRTGRIVTPEEREADKERGRAARAQMMAAFRDVPDEPKPITMDQQIRRMELEDQISFMLRKQAAETRAAQ